MKALVKVTTNVSVEGVSLVKKVEVIETSSVGGLVIGKMDEVKKAFPCGMLRIDDDNARIIGCSPSGLRVCIDVKCLQISHIVGIVVIG